MSHGWLGGVVEKPTRGVVFGIAAVAVFMSSLDLTIVATALPSIHHSLGASINWSAWSITAYGIGLVITYPTAGKLSDQYGRRRVFLYGVALFTVSSLACGASPSIYVLIVFRVLQAIGGGTILPSATGIVSDHFGESRDRAIGLFGTVAASGQITGPILGGILVSYLSWRWIFFVNVPIGLALVGTVVRVIPESGRLARSPLDIRGITLMSAFLFTSVFGITIFGSGSTVLTNTVFGFSETCAAALLLQFLRHTRRAEAPIIPMRLLRGRGFGVVNGINFLWGVTGFGVATLLPLYAEQRYHLGAFSAGTLLTARAIGTIAIGAIAALALRRTGYRLPLAVGFALVAIGTIAMSLSPRWSLGPYPWLTIGAGVAGLGNGVANPASRNACLELAPEDVAAITGLRSMFVFMGVIFSVSIVTSFLNRSLDPGLAQAHVLLVIAVILVLIMIPLVTRVPEHRGRW